ncbi:hypothetical protein D3C78_1155210 [compost metagenome]
MIEQGWGVDSMLEGKIDHPGQQQVVDLILDSQQLRKRQLFAFDGEINVGAGAVVAFGARAIEQYTLDLWPALEYCTQFLDGMRGQTKAELVSHAWSAKSCMCCLNC